MKSSFITANPYTYEKQIYQLKYSVYTILFVFSLTDSLNILFSKVMWVSSFLPHPLQCGYVVNFNS